MNMLTSQLVKFLQISFDSLKEKSKPVLLNGIETKRRYNSITDMLHGWRFYKRSPEHLRITKDDVKYVMESLKKELNSTVQEITIDFNRSSIDPSFPTSTKTSFKQKHKRAPKPDKFHSNPERDERRFQIHILISRMCSYVGFRSQSYLAVDVEKIKRLTLTVAGKERANISDADKKTIQTEAQKSVVFKIARCANFSNLRSISILDQLREEEIDSGTTQQSDEDHSNSTNPELEDNPQTKTDPTMVSFSGQSFDIRSLALNSIKPSEKRKRSQPKETQESQDSQEDSKLAKKRKIIL